MKVKMFRTDDRLIHGQVMVRWVGGLGIKKIVIFDEEISKDPMLASIFELACPQGVELIIEGVAASAEVQAKLEGHGERTLVLTRSPITMAKVIESGFESENGYNIGPMSNKPDTTKLAPFCYLLADEIEALKEVHEREIEIFVQTVPDAEKLVWSDLEKLF